MSIILMQFHCIFLRVASVQVDGIQNPSFCFLVSLVERTSVVGTMDIKDCEENQGHSVVC